MKSEDLSFYESAVMNDTAFGGGGISTTKVIDGQSNNLFPDSSDLDRALGRFQMRKVFGKGDTDDTETLSGAFAMLVKPPADPLTACTIFETSGWAATRATAVQLVERYLNKSTRLLCRVLDTHYAGSKILSLYNVSPGTGFPESGDPIVVFNPSGQEQYVRVLEAVRTTQVVYLEGATVTLNICACELGDELEFDLLGRPAQRDSPSVLNTATVFSTAPSAGIKFCGVKPVSNSPVIGDREVVAEGGIFTSLVPAATSETPVVDVYPLTKRASLSRTARSAVTLPVVVGAVGPGTILRLPTAAEPGSLSISLPGATLVENAAGEVQQGSVTVARVHHKDRIVEFEATAPNYGTPTVAITYKPATSASAGTHSGSVEITDASQGFGWVFAFEPAPAPGTLSVSYLAQGRWYELVEDGTGRLSGSDSSYGTGSLSFSTGSLALTLGALPDVGSDIIMVWGDANSAVAAPGTLPTRVRKKFALPTAPVPGSVVFSWTRGTAESCTLNADGTTTGPGVAGGLLKEAIGYSVWVEPDHFPDNGVVAMTYQSLPDKSAFTVAGSTFTLEAPVKPGSVHFNVLGTSTSPTGFAIPATVFACRDDGAGIIRCGAQAIGTINYSTGAMALTSPTFTTEVWTTVKRTVWAPVPSDRSGIWH